MPSRAAARLSAASTKAEPLSTYTCRGRPVRPAPGAAPRPAARCPRIAPAGGHHRPGMIIEEGEQVRLAAFLCAVQRVAGPQLVRPGASTGRRPAAGARPGGCGAPPARSAAAACAPTGTSRMTPARSSSPARRCGRASPASARRPAPAPARRYAGDLPGPGGASAANPPTPGPDPPVYRRPRHHHLVAERPRMRPGGQLPDQPAAAGWTAPDRRPRGSADTGTRPPARRGPPACGHPQPQTSIPPR